MFLKFTKCSANHNVAKNEVCTIATIGRAFHAALSHGHVYPQLSQGYGLPIYLQQSNQLLQHPQGVLCDIDNQWTIFAALPGGEIPLYVVQCSSVLGWEASPHHYRALAECSPHGISLSGCSRLNLDSSVKATWDHWLHVHHPWRLHQPSRATLWVGVRFGHFAGRRAPS